MQRAPQHFCQKYRLLPIWPKCDDQRLEGGTKGCRRFLAGELDLRRQLYPRHLNNFGLFGVEAHGLWTQKDDVALRVFVLVSYADGDDPGEVALRYIQSPEAANDARGFDVADILGVESTMLIRSASSQLK